jgi:hypothetical protein
MTMTEKCVEYLGKHPRATYKTLIKNLGVSRATAYNSVRAFKKANDTVKPEKVNKVKQKPAKVAVKQKKPVQSQPSFTIEGTHFEKDPNLKVEGKVAWSDVVYNGLCSVCGKEVMFYKTAIMFSNSGIKEVECRYNGKCLHCDISFSFNKSRR